MIPSVVKRNRDVYKGCYFVSACNSSGIFLLFFRSVLTIVMLRCKRLLAAFNEGKIIISGDVLPSVMIWLLHPPVIHSLLRARQHQFEADPLCPHME